MHSRKVTDESVYQTETAQRKSFHAIFTCTVIYQTATAQRKSFHAIFTCTVVHNKGQACAYQAKSEIGFFPNADVCQPNNVSC